VIGGGGNMKEGVTLKASLYYRNDAGEMVTVASRSITNTASRFPYLTKLVYLSVDSPIIVSNSPAAGKHIGIMLASTVGFEDAGGYWDIDNVSLGYGGGFPFRHIYGFIPVGEDSFRITWAANQGMSYQLQSSADLSAWTNVGEPQSSTGPAMQQIVPREAIANRFFRVQQFLTP